MQNITTIARHVNVKQDQSLTSKYYDLAPMLSRNAFINFDIGHRGVGKTFGFKKWAIKDFIKNGVQFLWIRRYHTELDLAMASFFKDLQEKGLFKDHKFRVKEVKELGYIYMDDKVIGYYCSLTRSVILKSSSFPQVDKIIFDEFLIMGKTYHYLNDEVTVMLELIETIFRDRENDPYAIHPRGVYFIGNNVTIANPYFLYFNIMPKKTNRFTYYKDRDILVENYKNQAFIDQKKKSHMGRLTAGTQYEEYAIENEAYLDNDDFIAKKPSVAKFYCAIKYKSKVYGFWMDWQQGRIYVNYQYDPSSYNIYSLTRDDHTINTFLIENKSSSFIKSVLWLFRNACMYFDNQQIKNQVYEVLAHFVR